MAGQNVDAPLPSSSAKRSSSFVSLASSSRQHKRSKNQSSDNTLAVDGDASIDRERLPKFAPVRHFIQGMRAFVKWGRDPLPPPQLPQSTQSLPQSSQSLPQSSQPAMRQIAPLPSPRPTDSPSPHASGPLALLFADPRGSLAMLTEAAASNAQQGDAAIGAVEVVDLSDNDDDGVDAEGDTVRRAELAFEARVHLNDLAPGTPNGVPLFSSRFAAPPTPDQSPTPAALSPLAATDILSSPVYMASPPETPQPQPQPHAGPSRYRAPPRRPDINVERANRSYAWDSPRDTSPASSRSSGRSSSAAESPRQVRHRKSSNLRNGPDTSARLASLHRHQQRAKALGDGSEKSFQRVIDEVKLSEEKQRTTAPRIKKLDNEHTRDLVKSIGGLQLDTRRPLDEAVRPLEKTYVPTKFKIKPSKHVPFDRQRSEFVLKYEREKAEEERKIALRTRPAIPRDLSPEQSLIANARLNDPSFKADIGTEQVIATSLRRLLPGQWLNDEVINAYAEMITTRAKKEGRKVHCMTSYFYSKLSTEGYEQAKLKRWTKRMKLDVFSLDKFIMPINVGNMHWVCAVVNFVKKRIEYYDSLSDSGHRHQVFHNLRSYLKAEHLEKMGSTFDLTGWTDYYSPKTPRQDNSSDCGVFASQTLESAARGRDLAMDGFEFSAANMPFFRRFMVIEIASGEMGKRTWAS